jgi:hypothetical protein
MTGDIGNSISDWLASRRMVLFVGEEDGMSLFIIHQLTPTLLPSQQTTACDVLSG